MKEVPRFKKKKNRWSSISFTIEKGDEGVVNFRQGEVFNMSFHFIGHEPEGSCVRAFVRACGRDEGLVISKRAVHSDVMSLDHISLVFLTLSFSHTHRQSSARVRVYCRCTCTHIHAHICTNTHAHAHKLRCRYLHTQACSQNNVLCLFAFCS